MSAPKLRNFAPSTCGHQRSPTRHFWCTHVWTPKNPQSYLRNVGVFTCEHQRATPATVGAHTCQHQSYITLPPARRRDVWASTAKPHATVAGERQFWCPHLWTPKLCNFAPCAVTTKVLLPSPRAQTKSCTHAAAGARKRQEGEPQARRWATRIQPDVPTAGGAGSDG